METETIHRNGTLLKAFFLEYIHFFFPGSICYDWSAVQLNMVVPTTWMQGRNYLKKKQKKTVCHHQTARCDSAGNSKRPREGWEENEATTTKKNILSQEERVERYNLLAYQQKTLVHCVNNTLSPRWENSLLPKRARFRITSKVTYRCTFPGANARIKGEI